MSHRHFPSLRPPPFRVAKLTGADAELGNLILGLARDDGTGREASLALLREIDGVPGLSDSTGVAAGTDAPGTAGAGDPRDVGRRFLDNGGCAYIDLDHLEICTAEVRSAHEFVAAWHGMLRIARDAMAAANAKCPPDRRIVVLVNSSDGRGNSYGSHQNFLVTRALWDDLFVRRLHPELFVLIAYQVSSIVCTGQGKVGAENGRPPVAYQISQRADFFDQLVGSQTTFNRPIVNSRDEPLCDGAGNRGAPFDCGLARLHCIFYDPTLCHAGTMLKVGGMQIVLAMLEAGWLDASLMLEDPLGALTAYSHDPDLAARARLVDGRAVTAAELQSLFCERARAFVDAGECAGLVPGARTVVELWEDTLGKLVQRDFDGLAPRLDWVLKRAQIERALVRRGLDWSAPEAKHIDHLYASLDPDEGVYWALEQAGLTEWLVGAERIEQLRRMPPDDTRAWSRAMLLRRLPRERIHRVDWDRIELAASGPGQVDAVLHLPDPRRHGRKEWRAAGFDDDHTRSEGATTRANQT